MKRKVKSAIVKELKVVAEKKLKQSGKEKLFMLIDARNVFSRKSIDNAQQEYTVLRVIYT